MMADEQHPKPDSHPLPVYAIKVQGHLSRQWLSWFDGLTITLEEDGNTLLSGSLVDQSALHGVLKKIRDLGVPLLSVNSGDPNRPGDS